MKWTDLTFWKSREWEQIRAYLQMNMEYYPLRKDIFNALKFTPLEKVKVVILGQDPYPNGEANGLAFSTNGVVGERTSGLKTPGKATTNSESFTTKSKPWPPTLMNIFEEYSNDTGFPVPCSGNLERWSRRGVLLLNRSLTVKCEVIGSHKNLGWDVLVSEIVETVRKVNPGAVFVLWGRDAQGLALPIIGDASVVTSAHPSPRSANRGFLGSRPFSKVNALLVKNGLGSVPWYLEHRLERIQDKR